MPELPEVETARRGIAPHVVHRVVTSVQVRERRLRWPVPRGLEKKLAGRKVKAVSRRAKYLFLEFSDCALMIHLGMSGSLRIVTHDPLPPQPHDHVDIVFDDGAILRYRDPRRFGSIHFIGKNRSEHPLLARLGPEPLSDDFDGRRLYTLSRKRQAAVKNFIMDASVVVGVGNIYACESLFKAGVRPSRPAGKISAQRYEALAQSIKTTLGDAIVAGGTTLRDFVNADGQAGYFSQKLDVYGREGEPCVGHCGATIRRQVIGQRSTFYCVRCQS